MLLLRLVGILALVTIGVSFALYVVSRDRRYLRFAWRVFLGTLVFAVLLMLFYAAERFLMVI
ncbi:MAG: hypothetical protein KIS79_08745 [Burkholderiales bacterium]|nr:hypothetical protein [Burkholderiales bacterium]MCW5621178.1 hypothetical protein [Burkholderiales bacterium]